MILAGLPGVWGTFHVNKGQFCGKSQGDLFCGFGLGSAWGQGDHSLGVGYLGNQEGECLGQGAWETLHPDLSSYIIAQGKPGANGCL